ncbi:MULTISPECIES: ferritin-like domain-containing protein [Hymenobacter]|uniref:Ferritin-like domain-containing protein n=1 Tax=Hymenobacter armeniacus TaxID=2771358 RepID=A0ABR8JUD3_9BACT|nr:MULTISPECIES: ferritin-like domain-containing protein [Hymenobacter]MBD2722937.1 ferritin-like domain-containing protein [Hymenobacter armeniacus]MBJ6108991.1 ferritin-like domain-containing protein [Hymenobacter sp. BT523]
MNFFNIINQLAEVDPDVMGRLDTRRSVFNSLTSMSKRAAMAAGPALLASFFTKAYAGTTAGDPKEVFNYALTLEYLEADFYNKMIASPYFSTASAAAQAAIRQISKHETAHVNLLKAVVTGIGGTPTPAVTFKSATFASLTSFAAQLQVAQLLEDTGVRAYKGRAGDLLGLADVTITGIGTINPLQSALQIHSVEARHAAHIRYMRNQTPWITGTGDLDSQPHYTGAIPESNTTQSNVNLIAANSITPNTTYSAADAAASFDEILTPAEVTDNSRAGGLIGA